MASGSEETAFFSFPAGDFATIFLGVVMVLKLCTYNLKQRAATARQGATDDNLSLLRIDNEDFQICDGHTVCTETTRHLHSLRHATSSATSASANRAWGALCVFLSVSTRTTVETVTLHHAREALALRDSRNLHDIADCKYRSVN